MIPVFISSNEALRHSAYIATILENNNVTITKLFYYINNNFVIVFQYRSNVEKQY